MTYEIVVTEVTLYGSKLRCVAGYDRERGEMIRPEPEAAGFWHQIVCGAGTTFHPGHVVRFRGEKPETDWPHRTEDVVVIGEPYWTGTLDDEAFKAVLHKAAHFTSRVIFGRHLAFEGRTAFVPAGAPCGSLACETLDASDVRLADDVFKDQHKLRARIMLEGHVLELPVAAKDLKQAFLKHGVEAARALLPRWRAGSGSPGPCPALGRKARQVLSSGQWNPCPLKRAS